MSSPCPACGTATADGFRYCPACGTDLDLPESPTGTAPRPTKDGPAGPVPSPAPAASPKLGGRRSEERFVPGSVLAGRYRIIGLLGRGGMGEVYRADDLKLGQPVALKFLTPAFERDPERLARLYAEVRTARQVSHPAVCRVWDIAEADGQHFLSMEFVDGENLASLLRRIGRFPQDKARDVAVQIAEGLAAAHAKGLLHRDLKPANVMLDGQGQVRLTDFGLAGLAESLTSADVRSGTPSYMSPEQLAGREVSARSDIYSLGLVIYELVTGRRAFEGRGFAELARRHRDERPIDPAVLAPGLEPALERTILACLEKDPRRRPASALVVAAMLAGRDPLEAAIAAGETPSPELVAAAGEREGLTARAAWACLAVVVVGTLALPVIDAPRQLLARVPAEKSPAALEDRARELISELAPVRPFDHAGGFAYDADYVLWAEERDRSPSRWASLATGEPPLVSFWHRQSARPFAPTGMSGRVSWDDPPVRLAGMAGVRYDLRGRLLAFYVVPAQLEKEPQAQGTAPPDWSRLFSEARLDPQQFRRVEPRWTPSFYVDERVAWEGAWPARPEIALRVEAASYRGRPVWFELKDPWTRPEREESFPLTATQRHVQAFYLISLVLLEAIGGVLAYRNIRLGRGDRQGAFRLALVLTCLATAAWALRAHHPADLQLELASFGRGAGLSLLIATMLWLFYLALEPYVRRLRPWTLVSWTRLLGGGLRDAVVGRDVLIGLVFGTCLALLSVLLPALAAWLQLPERAPQQIGLDALIATRGVLSMVVGFPVNATLVGLGLLLLFLVLRLLTRRDWIAAALVVAFVVAGEAVDSRDGLWLVLPLATIAWASFVLLLLRFGLVAAITGVWCSNMLAVPPLAYSSGWTGAAAALVIPLVLAVAVLAFRSASGGPSGLRQRLAADAVTSRPS